MKKKVLYTNHSVFKENCYIGEQSPEQKKTTKSVKKVPSAKMYTEKMTKSVKKVPSARVYTEKRDFARPEQKPTRRNNIFDTIKMLGKEVAEKYIIEKTIGQGGMGVVYLAEHKILRKKYAVKFLHDRHNMYNADDALEERFISEARIAIELRHQNLVEVYDIGQHDKRMYMVMEHVNGETVEEVVEQRGKFCEEDVVHVLIGVLQALDTIHKQGYVHRDIKPSNIMIHENGDVKLMDLGIAKDLKQENGLTQPNIIIGTLEYMPPEQIANTSAISHASDLYSLGATAFFMLTGKNYVEGTNLQKIRSICSGEFTIDIPNVEHKLLSVIQGLMEIDIEKRFSSAMDVIEILNGIKGV